MVTVDLNTRVLPTGHRVFMVRPGSGYNLLKPFIDNQAIAPDLPFFDIPDGERPRDYSNVDDQIKRARAFAEWVKTEETRSAPPPELELVNYAKEDSPARVAMYRNTADEILFGLPKGSLIFVPNPNLTESGLFGELAESEGKRISFFGTGHRSKFKYLGRKLNNAKLLPMRKLPPSFIDPMKRRNWIHEFDGRESELLYRQYYGDFEILGRKTVSEISVTKQRVIPLDLSIIGALTTLIDQNLLRYQHGDTDLLGMLEAVFLAPDDEGPVIHANLGSPGNLLVESVRRSAAPVLKVILALALAGFTGYEIHDFVDGGQLAITNSQSLPGVEGGSLDETQQLTYDFVRSTGRDSLNQIVELVRDFHDRTGGNVNASVNNE